MAELLRLLALLVAMLLLLLLLLLAVLLLAAPVLLLLLLAVTVEVLAGDCAARRCVKTLLLSLVFSCDQANLASDRGFFELAMCDLSSGKLIEIELERKYLLLGDEAGLMGAELLASWQ